MEADSTPTTHLLLALSLLGSLSLRLPRLPHSLLPLRQLLLSSFPLLLTLVLLQLLGIGLHLFQPLVRLLVEVDLAGGGEILGGVSEVAEEPVSPASPLVGGGIVRIELYCSRAVLVKYKELS